MITSLPLGGTYYIDFTLVHPGTGAGWAAASTSDIAVRVYAADATVAASTPGWSIPYSEMTFARASDSLYQVGAHTDGTLLYLATATSHEAVYEDLGDGAGALLRIEHAATQQCLYSDEIDNATWLTFGAATVTAGLEGPAGSTAERVEVAAGTNIRYQNLTPGAGWRAYSAYVRATSGPVDHYIYLYDGSTKVAVGTLRSTYTRLRGAMNCGAGAGNIGVADSRLGTPVAAGARDVRVSLVQLESGRYATSPIRSAGVTAARAADTLTLAAASVPASLFTKAAQFSQFSPEWGSADLASGDERWLLAFDTSTTGADGIRIRHDGTNVLLEALSSGVVRASATFGVFLKDALLGPPAWDPEAGIVYINNVAGATGTAWTWPTSSIRVGGVYGGAKEADGRFGMLEERYIDTSMRLVVTPRAAAHVGSYYATLPLPSESKYTVGQVYNVVAEVTVAGVATKGVISTFVVQPPVLTGTVAAGTGTASATTFKSDVELPETPYTIFAPADVRMWLRSSEQIVYSTSPNVASWTDRTPNAIVMAASGVRPVISSGVVDFNGSTMQMRTAYSSAFDITGNLTIATMVRPDTLAGARCWASFGVSGNGPWSMQYAGELRLWMGVPGTNGGAVSSAAFTSGQWHTVIWVYTAAGATNADKLKCYVNGVAQTLTFYGTVPSAVPTGSAYGSPPGISLGCFEDGVQYADVAFSEFLLISDNADTTQVASLHALLDYRGTDHWKDCLVTFTSGVLAGQVQKVTGYNGDDTYFTVGSAFSAAPAVGDKFLILNH